MSTPAVVVAYSLIATGNVLVLSSMYALGVTGTYLGDYFGILMNERVTSFPFNVTDAPMYYGSTLSFLGTAILFGKPAGLLLTLEVLIVYLVALRFEEYCHLLDYFSSKLILSTVPLHLRSMLEGSVNSKQARNQNDRKPSDVNLDSTSRRWHIEPLSTIYTENVLDQMH